MLSTQKGSRSGPAKSRRKNFDLLPNFKLMLFGKIYNVIWIKYLVATIVTATYIMIFYNIWILGVIIFG